MARVRRGRRSGLRLRHLRRRGRKDPPDHRPDRHPAVHASRAHQPGPVRSSGRRVLHGRPALRAPRRAHSLCRAGDGLQRRLPPRFLAPAEDSRGRRGVGRTRGAAVQRPRPAPDGGRGRVDAAASRAPPCRQPPMARAEAPEDFDAVERAATVVRGAFTDEELSALASSRRATPGRLPNSGRRAAQPSPVRSRAATCGPGRRPGLRKDATPFWRTRKALLLAGTAALLLVAMVVGFVVFACGPANGPTAGPAGRCPSSCRTRPFPPA